MLVDSGAICAFEGDSKSWGPFGLALFPIPYRALPKLLSLVSYSSFDYRFVPFHGQVETSGMASH